MSDTTKYGDGFWKSFQPDAKISARTFRTNGQPISGPGLIFLRPPDHDDDPGFPGPDDDPPPPDPCAGKPFVRAPIVAAQIDLGFGSSQPRPCPSTADRQRIASSVSSQFRNLLPNADVRIACKSHILSIAVWEAFNGNQCEDQARQRGIDRLDLLEGNEAFGFMLKNSLILFQANRSFELAPKQLSGNGAPSAFGPLHLTGLSVDFVPPDKVITRVDGYDDRPLPDVDFTVTITDQFEPRAVADTTRDLSTSGAWKAVLAALFLGAGGVFLSPLLFPIGLWALFGDLQSALGDHGSGGEAGVGARALGLVPREIPLPGQTKLQVFYGRSEVTSAALFFGGSMLQAARQAAAAISGPTQLVMANNARDVSDVYRVVTADTFGTVTITWSGEPGVRIDRASGQETAVAFKRPDAPDGVTFTRTVSATVTDQDGFTKQLTKTVEIFLLDDDGMPAICQKHPSLPQCRPDGPQRPPR